VDENIRNVTIEKEKKKQLTENAKFSGRFT
jgi:hypothetical protein